MGIDIYIQFRNRDGEFTGPSDETIIRMAELVLRRPVDYNTWKERYEEYHRLTHLPWEQQDDDAQFAAWEAMANNGGDLLDDLHHHRLPRCRAAVVVACDMTESRDPNGYIQEGASEDMVVIQAVVQTVFPGQAGYRIGELIDRISWA